MSEICGFVDVGHPMWREDGSVVSNPCWASPTQSFSVPSPAGLTTILWYHVHVECYTTAAYERVDWVLWSSGQSSWLQIQRFGFDSWRYQIFWEVADLERGPLSLVSTIEEPSERKISGSGLENRHYGSRELSNCQVTPLYPRKLALTSPTKRMSLCQYSSLVDRRLGIQFSF
jgi:hypothetical protein